MAKIFLSHSFQKGTKTNTALTLYNLTILNVTKLKYFLTLKHKNLILKQYLSTFLYTPNFTLYLVRTGLSKIELVTCKILTFLPKNTGIKLKTMYA